jgi:hypothetical protein
MRWLAPIITAGCLLAAGSGAGTVAAQTMEPGSWMRDWSPLAPVADLPRTIPVAPALPALLTAPAPRVGLHWSAGNPAGLAFEGADEWGDFTMGYASEAGDFRRPLDPGEVHSGMLAGSGWRPLGPGAVSGGVALQRTGLGGDAFANARTPYRSSPHTSADTSGADMVELVTRVEGAGGWRVGGWGLGLAVGYETFDGRTDVSPTPRFRRGGAPAATVGVVRALGAGVVAGAHARIQRDVETLSVSSPRTDVARVYPLEGYTNPVGVDYSTGGYNRRIEGDAYAFGLSASFRALDARWVAWGEVSERTERQSSQILSDPPSDDWRTNGATAGLAAARPIAGDRWLVVANVTWTRVTGEATRVALEEEGVLFEATEAALVGWGEVRWIVAPEWRLALRGLVERQDRRRWDLVAGTGIDLSVWRPAFAAEGAWTTGRLALALGTGVGWHTPAGGIPDPTGFNAGYQRFVAPELALESTPTLSHSTALTLRWAMQGQTRLWIRTGFAALAPRHAPYTLPLQPDGRRSRWSIAVGSTRANPFTP